MLLRTDYPQDLILKHTCYAILDVFPEPTAVLVVGNGFELIPALDDDLFSIEGWGLDWSCSIQQERVYEWKIGNKPFFGPAFADLMISFNTNLDTNNASDIWVAKELEALIKPGGHALFVDPQDSFVARFGIFMDRAPLKENELRSYSLFADSDINVYRKRI